MLLRLSDNNAILGKRGWQTIRPKEVSMTFHPMLPLMSAWAILAIVFGVVAIAIGVLYYMGRKLQKRQADAETQIESMKQTVSILVIDKKRLKPEDSGLPEASLAQLPWYAKRSKIPIVKAKIGPQIMSLMADQKVFEIIPVKKECKVALSGIYISELKSVRGGKIPEPEPKKSFFQKLFKK